MAKLYPPILSGTLPAFFLEETNEDRIVKITVPFTMNRAVSKSQVNGFALRIKTVQNNSYLYTAKVTDATQFNMEDSSWVVFTLKISNNADERDFILRTLKVGTFYKLQLAYIDNTNEIGNFSTVAIGKFTTKPILTINHLKKNITNTHLYDYTGFYDQQDGDYTEKVYSYRFDVYDENDNIIMTSGDNVHNTTTDVELNNSYDNFTYPYDLDMDKVYKIQYSITTNNELSLSSPLYRITQKITVDSDLKADLIASANFDDGYIKIELLGKPNEVGVEEAITGSFILSRASEDSNFMYWEKLSTFKIIAEPPTRILWNDFTAEQGKNYKYSIQQYNDNQLYSNRIISNTVFSDFEDAFLYDGERQLKIRFNPKLGNMKTNILDTKVDTLGHKYPFFFRNSQVNYKEFTISGLLSYLSDDNFFFITKEELKLEEELHRHDTASNDEINDSVSLNIARERLFKMKVIEWLNDGKPKLFRSPTEGNFIVRLMKVTLNPERKLGRLLHTFNGTAYEVADYNYNNLIDFNFINFVKNEDIKILNWSTIEFTKQDENGNYIYKTGQTLNEYPTNNVQFTNMRPGQLIKLLFEDGNEEIIMIGATGSYTLDSQISIIDISLLESNIKYSDGIFDPYLTGQMTYSFQAVTSNNFSKISNIQISDIPVQQFIGKHDILQEIEYINYNNVWYKNPKIELLKINSINCYKRDIEEILYDKAINKYYIGQTNEEFIFEKANPLNLYKIGNSYEQTAQYSPTRIEWKFNPAYYLDTYNNRNYQLDEYNPGIKIDNNEISVQNITKFRFIPDKLTTLIVENGAVADISYQIRTTDFLIEDDDYYPVYNRKIAYLEATHQLEKYFEILGFLGSYTNSENVIKSQLEMIESWLQEDMQNSIEQYNQQLADLEINHKNIKDVAWSNHQAKIDYINGELDKILEDKIVSDDEQIDYFQLTQALYVENYEYDKYAGKDGTLDKEYENTKKSIEQKITDIRTSYEEEKLYFQEKYNNQLKELQENRKNIIKEAKKLFPDTNEEDWENNEYLYNVIELPLRKKVNNAYTHFIISLIESQEMEKVSEGLA